MNLSKHGPEIAAALLVAALGFTTATISGATEASSRNECKAQRSQKESDSGFATTFSGGK